MNQFAQLEQQYALPEGLLTAVMNQESGGNSNAVSPKGAMGAFQFMPATAQQYGIDPNDPNQAAQGAARMFGDLSKKYSGDVPSMLAGYNWGQGNVDRRGLNNAPPETQQYIQKIQNALPQYADAGNIANDAQIDPTKKVSDPALLAQLNGGSTGNKVTDPTLLAQLNGGNLQSQEKVGIGRTAFDQSMQGATFGFSDEIQNRIGAGIAHVATGEPYDSLLTEANQLSKDRLKAEIQQNPGTSIAANLAGGLLTGGAGAETAAGGMLANSLRTGNIASRVVKGAAAGAASGALYGAGSADEGNRIEGAKQGAILGGAFGAAVPAAGAAFGALKNTVLPSASDTLKPLAQKALDYGIPLTRAQIGDSKIAKTVASTVGEIPLSGSAKFYQKQQGAFNGAIANTIGESADKITPEVIDSAYTNIGKKFDDALAGQTVQFNMGHIDQLATLDAEASKNLSNDSYKTVKSYIGDFLNNMDTSTGTMSGEKIGDFMSSLTRAIPKVEGKATIYLNDLKGLVVDMATEGAPDRKALLSTARLQYKNLKTIEPLAEKAIDGNISPSLLLNRVRSKFSDFSTGGGGDLGTLARIGQTFLKDSVPNSGTAKRLATYTALFEAPAMAMGGPAALAGGLGKAAGGIAMARGFNAANTSQKLVKNAVQGKNLPQIRSMGIIPGETALIGNRK